MSESFLDREALRTTLEGIGSLGQIVGSDAGTFALNLEAATAKGNQVSVFGENLGIDSSISVAATIHEAAESLQALGTPDLRFAAPIGRRLVALDLRTRLGVSANPTRTFSQATLTGNLAAGAEFAYRRLTTAADGEKRLAALTRLVGATGLPHRLEIADFPEGVSEETLRLSLDLGFKASAGRGFALGWSKRLFKDMSARLAVQGEAAIGASLGFVLLDQYSVLAGRGPLIGTDDAVRIRIERIRRRQLSLGASLSLGLHFEATGLEAILEAVFNQLPPIPRALELLEQVAQGDWDKLNAEVSDELADALNGWLADTGWRTWAAADPRVQKLISASQRIVGAWQGLPGEIQSLWGSLLGRVDETGELRGHLKELAALTSAQDVLDRFEAASPKRAQAFTDLLELIGGRAFEELLAATDDVIEEVSGKARKALEVLDDPAQFAIGQLNAFAERTGIQQLVELLRDRLSSLDGLEQWQQESVKKLAVKLTDRAWDELVADGPALQKLQDWADGMARHLRKLTDFEEELKKAASELKGDIGFSVGIEFERVSQSSALLDVEIDIDSSDSLRNAVEKAFGHGDVAGILQALDQADRDGKEGFRLRECLFFSRKTRTSSGTTMLQIAGFGGFAFSDTRKDTRMRVEERQLSFGDSGRRGRWSGGAIRSQEVLQAQNQIALWLDVEDGDAPPASGQHPSRSLTGPFSREASKIGLRVRYSLEELELSQDPKRNELRAIVQLLEQLGFRVDPQLEAPDQAHARLAIGVDFDLVTFEKVLSQLDDIDSWNRQYLTAGGRWFLDQVMAAMNADFATSQGRVISAFMKTQEFKDHWKKGARELALKLGGGQRTLRIGSRTKEVDILDVPETQKYSTAFQPMAVFMDGRGKSLAGQLPIQTILASARQARTDEKYTQLIETFAKHERSFVVSDNNWPSALFPLYLLIERLRNLDPELVPKVRGFASFRFKEGESAWSAPRRFRLLGLR